LAGEFGEGLVGAAEVDDVVDADVFKEVQVASAGAVRRRLRVEWWMPMCRAMVSMDSARSGGIG
jgi:hypothetical protein